MKTLFGESMNIGLVGRKCGMTRYFTETGEATPVSVIYIEPNKVVRTKSSCVDGYCSVQVTVGSRKRSNLSKPAIGEYAKAAVEAGRGLWEFRVNEEDLTSYAAGVEIGVDRFSVGDFVDVQGVTIGKGFAGVVKRYHFRMQDATHGNSLSHRAPGSIGQNQTPGRVFKGKKMAGHMGSTKTTIQNLRVVEINTYHSVILVKGAVPGPNGGTLVIKPATKKQVR